MRKERWLPRLIGPFEAVPFALAAIANGFSSVFGKWIVGRFPQ